MIRWLIDTGPLVAYVDGSDPAHELVAETIGAFGGRLWTTSAVLTEAMHLVSADPDGPAVLVEFLLASGTEIAEMSSRPDLGAAVRLMRKYHDTPMDFADATLVLLAERSNVRAIATLDRRGFSTYRAAGKPFDLVLGG